MSPSDLAYFGAAEALALFRARRLSPVELTEAILARGAATEPQMNALPVRFPDAALAAARMAEARYMGRGPAPRALEGLCVAIKDTTDLAGQVTASGSLTTSETPAARSGIANARVLAAGAIPHARSAAPEFSCSTTTWSRKWGVTRNPWHPGSTPGGSSGGAGAALAAGSTTLAMGSDIGGSIRIPAACCGVVGYKPPHGRVPQDPPFNFDPYCHTGPMARSVADAALLQNVLAGPHPRDAMSLPDAAPLDPGAWRDLRGVRIAWSADFGGFAVDDAVRADFAAACARLEDLGAHLVEVSPGWGAETVAAGLGHLRSVFGRWIAGATEGEGDRMTTYARAFADDGRKVPGDAALRALRMAAEMGAGFGETMARHDLFVCPTLACPPIAATHDPSRDRIEIAGTPVDPLLGWALTLPFNMLSMFPVLSVPSGRTGDGRPLGMQIVGRAGDENRLFAAGQAFETARGPWYGDAADRPALLETAPAAEAENQTA